MDSNPGTQQEKTEFSDIMPAFRVKRSSMIMTAIVTAVVTTIVIVLTAWLAFDWYGLPFLSEYRAEQNQKLDTIAKSVNGVATNMNSGISELKDQGVSAKIMLASLTNGNRQIMAKIDQQGSDGNTLRDVMKTLLRMNFAPKEGLNISSAPTNSNGFSAGLPAKNIVLIPADKNNPTNEMSSLVGTEFFHVYARKGYTIKSHKRDFQHCDIFFAVGKKTVEFTDPDNPPTINGVGDVQLLYRSKDQEQYVVTYSAVPISNELGH